MAHCASQPKDRRCSEPGLLCAWFCVLTSGKTLLRTPIFLPKHEEQMAHNTITWRRGLCVKKFQKVLECHSLYSNINRKGQKRRAKRVKNPKNQRSSIARSRAGVRKQELRRSCVSRQSSESSWNRASSIGESGFPSAAGVSVMSYLWHRWLCS